MEVWIYIVIISYIIYKTISVRWVRKKKRKEKLQYADKEMRIWENEEKKWQQEINRNRQEKLDEEKRTRKKMLEKANRLVERNQFERAIEIYEEFGEEEELIPVLKKQAKVREKALDYDNAIRIWEELGEIKEAARIRRLRARQGSVRIAQRVVHGDYVDDRDTIVKDSVLNRSKVGSKGVDKLTKIKELKELHDAGAIDDDEFKQMKKEILGKV